MFSLALGPTKYIGSPDKEVTPETILIGKNIINKLVLASQSGLTPCYSVDCVAHQAPRSVGFPRQEYWSG